MGGDNTNNTPRTLKDIKDAEENEEGAEDKPQEWYTGEQPENGDELTDSRYGNMFREALRHGARHRHDDTEDNTTTTRSQSVFFSGRGRKMTEEEKEEDALDGDLKEEETEEEDKKEEMQIERVITFYDNGFTVDDGPLRDPSENQEFIEMIGRGMCPPELMHPGASARNPVKIDLKRERRDWTPPKGVKAFSGSGNKLEGAEGEGNDEGVRGGGGGGGKALEEMKPWSVDEKEPTTSIQIRLRDGSRLVAKFNLSHTVAHIRDFIRQANGEASATRQLQLSGFPPEKLDDDSRTIGNGLKGLNKERKKELEMKQRVYDRDGTYVSEEGSDFFKDPEQLKAVAIFCAFLASFLSLGNIGAAFLLPIIYGKPLQSCIGGIVFGLPCPGIDF
ncbi:unnamed protein product [Bathycoccus prasinos]